MLRYLLPVLPALMFVACSSSDAPSSDGSSPGGSSPDASAADGAPGLDAATSSADAGKRPGDGGPRAGDAGPELPDAGGRACPPFPLFPDETCTGVPSGYPVTTVASLSTTSTGMKIDGKRITGDLDVQHDGVTVTNTRIYGHVNLNGHSGLVLQDVDLGPDACPAATNGGTRAVNGDAGYTLMRVHVHHNATDLMLIGGGPPAVIRDSLLNSTCYYPGDHLDVVQFYDPGAVGNITIEHSNLDARPVNVTGELANSAIFWADNPGGGSTLSAFHNKFAGGNYTTALYDAKTGSNVVLDVHDNVYVKGSFQFGPCASNNSVAFDGTSGIKFANNVFDDKTAVDCGL